MYIEDQIDHPYKSFFALEEKPSRLILFKVNIDTKYHTSKPKPQVLSQYKKFTDIFNS